MTFFFLNPCALYMQLLLTSAVFECLSETKVNIFSLGCFLFFCFFPQNFFLSFSYGYISVVYSSIFPISQSSGVFICPFSNKTTKSVKNRFFFNIFTKCEKLHVMIMIQQQSNNWRSLGSSKSKDSRHSFPSCLGNIDKTIPMGQSWKCSKYRKGG